MARLFFAIRPAEDAAHALSRLGHGLAGRLGGRATPESKIHLTLAFLGDIEPDRMEAALAAGAAASGRAFSLVLDRLGAFRNARVAWAGASMAEPALLALQGSLAVALRIRGFELEERAFKPHVTLVRRIERPLREEAMAPVSWRVSDYALMRSEPGTGRYSTLARWPLE